MEQALGKRVGVKEVDGVQVVRDDVRLAGGSVILGEEGGCNDSISFPMEDVCVMFWGGERGGKSVAISSDSKSDSFSPGQWV